MVDDVDNSPQCDNPDETVSGLKLKDIERAVQKHKMRHASKQTNMTPAEPSQSAQANTTPLRNTPADSPDSALLPPRELQNPCAQGNGKII
jgi:hypothetical protein